MNEKFLSKTELKKRLHEEKFQRITISFYRYIIIQNLEEYKILYI